MFLLEAEAIRLAESEWWKDKAPETTARFQLPDGSFYFRDTRVT